MTEPDDHSRSSRGKRKIEPRFMALLLLVLVVAVWLASELLRWIWDRL